MKTLILATVLAFCSIGSVFSQVTSVKAIQMVGAMAADRIVSGVSDLGLIGAIYLDGEKFVDNLNTGSFLLGYTRNTTNTANENVFIGTEAGKNNTTGMHNVYMGYRAGFTGATNNYNVLVGYQAGYFNTAANNTLVGYQSGYNNTTGSNNSFYGYRTGYANMTGSNNSYIGHQAGLNNTGSDNVAVGVNAGQMPSNKGVFLGYGADATMAGLTNVIAIGYNAKVGQSNSAIWGGSGADAVKIGIYIANPLADLHINGKDAMVVPVGTTAQRPTTPQLGMIRFNTDTNVFEGYVYDTVSMTNKWLQLHP